MRLWLLKPRERLDVDPWRPSWDRCHLFIIRAKTESQAREIANENAGSENSLVYNAEKDMIFTPWLDNSFSSCEELTEKGSVKIILRQYRNA